MKFKVGDEVKYVGSYTPYKGTGGTVSNCGHSTVSYKKGGKRYTVHELEIVKINKPEDLYPNDKTVEIDEKTGHLTYVNMPKTDGGNKVKYTTEEYLAFIDKTFADMKVLITAKNRDYTNGAGPFANFEQASDFGVDPFQGLMLRMGDKMQRVKSYCKQGSLQVKGEGIEDCFKDFIGYSLIALAMLNEKKGKK